MPDKYLTTEEAAEHLTVQPKTLMKWRSTGTGPPYIKVGHLVRYLAADLDGWAAKQRVTPRS